MVDVVPGLGHIDLVAEVRRGKDIEGVAGEGRAGLQARLAVIDQPLVVGAGRIDLVEALGRVFQPHFDLRAVDLHRMDGVVVIWIEVGRRRNSHGAGRHVGEVAAAGKA
ncbi:hypothetical protein D3C71_1825750 [compost metagenome]